MKSMRIALPIAISSILIMGALFVRHSQTKTLSASLEQVASVNAISIEESGVLEDFTNTSTSNVATSTPPTLTDSLAQKIFSGYIGLKSQGSLNAQNVEILANKYAEAINSRGVGADKVSVDQINVVPDTKESFSLYGSNVLNSRAQYQEIVKQESQKLSSPTVKNISSFLASMSNIYTSFANELIIMEVPVSLVENHINLINNYLESAKATSVFGTTFDSTEVYIALTTQASKSAEEEVLILNIKRILAANGIISNSL